MKGRGGGARIGNRRALCQACNVFNQSVMRVTRARLKDKYPEEYAQLRLVVELELYPQVLERFLQKYPAARRIDGD